VASAAVFTSHHGHFGVTLPASPGKPMKHVVVLIAALLISIPLSHAQSSRPQFEVASIKPRTIAPRPGEPTVQLSLDASKGRLVATNVTPKLLMRYAYDRQLPKDEMLRAGVLFSNVSGLQVIGGPNWISTERFDIEAKPPAVNAISQEEMQLMMQSLLESRFQLKVHSDLREVPTYNLVVVKSGKLPPSDADAPPPPGLPPQPRGMLRTFTIGKPPSSIAALIQTMYGRGVSTSTLAMQLESWAGRPVFDKTNSTGLYDIHLEFSPAASRPQATTDTASDPSGPSIFTAIQQELGLKLESSKGPVEVLVIDSVQRPSEN